MLTKVQSEKGVKSREARSIPERGGPGGNRERGWIGSAGREMEFDASIDGRAIRCRITPDRDIAAPVLCFSGMAPMDALEGGTRTDGLGGYTEIQLPDLKAGRPHALSIGYIDSRFASPNRAWLPLGAYLRAGGACHELPPPPAGVGSGRPRPGKTSGKKGAAGGKAPPLALCPQPAGWQPAGGTLRCGGFASQTEPLGRADALARRAGLGPLLDAGGVPLETAPDPELPGEAYKLAISAERVELSHGGDAGAFYGGVTLATLMHTHGGALPCGEVADGPRFEWRGQHLDCARHCYSVETILRLLDLMALLKLNRFHWHFADDEAFRLELESLPELARTHFRGEGELLPGVFGGGVRSGGGYSREDAARVVARAGELNIEVMPEIEVPAHSLAVARVYPATRDPDDTGTEASVQGYPGNVMNPAMPESWRVWEAMADEIGGIFPFGILHLGGDELPPETWSGSPAARALKESEGLATTQDLLGWTMRRLASHVSGRGLTPAAWEEAALGKQGIGNDAILFSWTGLDGGLEAARGGYRVVMTPAQHTYLDMAHTGSADDWGANWAATFDLAEMAAWDPVPEDEPELEGRIIGVQGAFWSEFTTRDAEMEPMVAPRILGNASKAWQRRGSVGPDTLEWLADRYEGLFDRIGWSRA